MGEREQPLALALMDYHVAVLTEQRLLVLSRITGSIVLALPVGPRSESMPGVQI